MEKGKAITHMGLPGMSFTYCGIPKLPYGLVFSNKWNYPKVDCEACLRNKGQKPTDLLDIFLGSE